MAALVAKPPRRTSRELPHRAVAFLQQPHDQKGPHHHDGVTPAPSASVGIAAILALANGVNAYIKSVEEDTLSPVSAASDMSTGLDMTSMMMGSAWGWGTTAMATAAMGARLWRTRAGGAGEGDSAGGASGEASGECGGWHCAGDAGHHDPHVRLQSAPTTWQR